MNGTNTEREAIMSENDRQPGRKAADKHRVREREMSSLASVSFSISAAPSDLSP